MSTASDRQAGFRVFSKSQLIKIARVSETRVAFAERMLVTSGVFGFLVGLVVGVLAATFYILRVVL